MPELAEVETVARGLKALRGRRLVGVFVHDGRDCLLTPGRLAWLCGRRLAAVERWGKWLGLRLADGHRRPLWLLLHLGMTGRLLRASAGAPLPPHTHLRFALDTGEELRYSDPRRFGAVQVLAGDELRQWLARLGPDALTISWTAFRARLQRRARIKALLLDQRVLAGLGNIYADESLWRAGIHPARPACSLSAAERMRLWRSMRAVLRQAIRYRGTSVADYVDLDGRRGAFQKHLHVYGRAGQPCRRCRTPLVRILLAGRGTVLCPRCQPEGG